MGEITYNKEVAIIGGGPAGMSAAHFLLEKGKDVVVLERNSQVGGLARTISHEGFRFDLGSHRFFTKEKEISDFIEGLLKDELITVPRTSRIYFNNRYFDYPPTVINAFTGLGPLKSVKILASFLKQKLTIKPDKPKTFEDWMVAQFGTTMYETFFKHYTEKVWGLKCDEISANWASQRIKGMNLASAVRHAVLPSFDPPASLIDEFRYPKKGIGRICEKIQENLGDRVMTNACVTSVRKSDDSWVITATGNGSDITVKAKDIISTIPVTELINIMDPPVPDEVRQAAKKLSFRDIILVAIMFDCGPITKDSWVYVPDSDIVFGRLHEPTNWSPELSPPGKTTIVFDLFCFKTDDIWTKPDEDLKDMVLDDFVNIDMVKDNIKEKVLGYKVIRAKHAYPLQKMGYEEPLKIIKDHISDIGGLWTIGREGLFAYLNIDHAIESGMLAAQNIMGANHKIESVIEDSSYLESKRVRT
jgi:protoporphyrinogen oxidase